MAMTLNNDWMTTITNILQPDGSIECWANAKGSTQDPDASTERDRLAVIVTVSVKVDPSKTVSETLALCETELKKEGKVT